MKKEKIIDLLFDELENVGAFNTRRNKEYIKCSKYQQEKGEILYNYIDNNITLQDSNAMLKKLLEDYIDSCHSTYYCEFKMYYQQGFKDGIEFITN